MAPLRRRTSELLSLALVSCLLVSLVGAILVAIRDPQGALVVALFASAAAACAAHALDEGLVGLGYLGPLFIIFALGLYALRVLLGLPDRVIGVVAVAVTALVVVILGRALIASGSADYPYDE